MARLGSDPRSLARRPSDPAELLGQILTPPAIADRMARMLLNKRLPHPAAILDPAAGPATFPAALARTGSLSAEDELLLYDIDPNMIARASAWSPSSPCRCRIVQRDYLESEGEGPFDLVILNPPYVRQEWLDQKERYRQLFFRRCAARLPGTANLYAYFLVKAVRETKPGGYLCCIVYDSWQSTRFGAWLSAFLEQECESIEHVPLPGQPFHGRLIDATILFVRRRSAPQFLATQGSSVCAQRKSSRPLSAVAGLVPVDTLFQSKRGLRLKQARFFLGDFRDVDRNGATPFIKKSARVQGYCVPDDHSESALLLSPGHSDERVLRELQRRLGIAQANPQENVSILTWFRERRESWALHREPPYAPFLFNYYLRKRPRHLYNPRRAYSDNFYGLTPRYPLPPMAALALLNSTCFCMEILSQARNQGSGLAKVQLFEYRQAHIPDWRGFSKTCLRNLDGCGAALAARNDPCESLLEEIDRLLAAELGHPRMEPRRLRQLYQEVDRQAKAPSGKP